MKKTCLLFAALILLSCGINKKRTEPYFTSRNKIIGVQEFNSVFVLKSIRESNIDTSYILSIKRAYLKNQMLRDTFRDDEGKYISLNNTYNFELSNIRYRTSSMENFGVFLVFENDTIWRGENVRGRKYFLSRNSIGLYIKEK